MRKEIIKTLITDFHTSNLPEFSPRLFKVPIGANKIIVLTGVRRSGKTYHLYSIVTDLIQKGVNLKNILYFNFEDERIEENTFIFNNIIEAYRELYPEIDLAKCYFLFDEIQNIDGWEKFLRRMDEKISKNIFVTGSNAKLLSREISTSLRGRSVSFEIYPLSFLEYLNFSNIQINLSSEKSVSLIINAFEKFFSDGGFPELFWLSADIKNRTLQEYFNVMIFNDLIERYDITQTAILKYFCKRVIGNSAKEFSVNKIYNEIKSQGYKISKDTLYDFQGYVEAIYMAVYLSKYSESVVKQEFAANKVYCIDVGLASSIDPFFSKNKGTVLENLVLLELLKSGKTIFYYKNSFECDFLLYENEKIYEAIQVCADTHNGTTVKRELRGLSNACKMSNLKKGFIITIYDEEKIEFEGIEIEILPAYKYFLERCR